MRVKTNLQVLHLLCMHYSSHPTRPASQYQIQVLGYLGDNRSRGPLIIFILNILKHILFKELPTIPDLDDFADISRVGAALLHPPDHLHATDHSPENNMFSIEPLKQRCGDKKITAKYSKLTGVFSVQMKNCEPFVSGPEFAMDKIPGTFGFMSTSGIYSNSHTRSIVPQFKVLVPKCFPVDGD